MLKEERVYFPSGDLKLEGLYSAAGGERGVVISHPNPLMGGSMQNNVVESLVLAFYEKGYSTLRFNFRGVGRSQGIHDKGVGEENDVASAITFIQNRGVKFVAMSGYSFGAWVMAGYLQTKETSGPLVLIAPPVSVYPFPTEGISGKIDLIVCGDKDPFCQSTDIISFSQAVRAKSVSIFRTDHFFAGKEEDLIKTVKENLS